MAFRLKPGESVRHGLRRLARKQLRSAADTLTRRREKRETAVHTARRSLKKVRALLDVLEADDGNPRKQRKRLRKISHVLSDLRDADAIIQTFDDLRRRAPAAVTAEVYASVRRRLVEDKQRLMHETDWAALAGRASDVLRRAAKDARHWRSRHRKFPALAAAIADGRRRASAAMSRARSTQAPDDFHEWRKTVKILRYQLRLIEACGGRIRADVRTLDRIGTWLGEDHNIVVLMERLFGGRPLAAESGNVERLRAAAQRWQESLRRRAIEQGQELFKDPNGRYVGHVHQLWRAWRRSSNARRAQHGSGGVSAAARRGPRRARARPARDAADRVRQ